MYKPLGVLRGSKQFIVGILLFFPFCWPTYLFVKQDFIYFILDSEYLLMIDVFRVSMNISDD